MGWFWELSRKRRGGVSGPDPIDHTNVMAWAQATRRTPDAFEVKCIMSLDDVFRAEALKAAEKRRPKS